MPMTNFPQGFMSGLSVRGMPLLQSQPGNVFWVDNGPALSGGTSHDPLRTVGGSDNNPGTFQKPFATIYYAIQQCAQGNGDIIFVKPGHLETVNGPGTTTNTTDPTGTIVTSAQNTIALDVDGVAIVGLGTGSLRPTIQFSTAATANIPLRASHMSIQNILFVANFADVTSAITAARASVTASIAANVMTVTVAGTPTLYPGHALMGTGVVTGTIILSQISGTTGGVGTYQVSHPQTVASTTITAGTHDVAIENCVFRDNSSVLNFITLFTGNATANSCNGFRLANCRINSLGTTAATTAIKLQSATDHVQLLDNFGIWAAVNDTAALLAAGANAMTSFNMGRNVLNRPNTSSTGGSFVSGTTAWTGHCYDNYMYQIDASAGIWIQAGTHTGTLGYTNNFSPITGAVDASALINPAAV